MSLLLTNLAEIKQLAIDNEDENDDFREFLSEKDPLLIDQFVKELNDTISPKIDCTECGNCCKSLMINITADEIEGLATHLQMSHEATKAKFIDESPGGKMIIGSIPCHFLEGTKCSIYEQRFTECREFPHLHRPRFTNRLFGTLMYYNLCPIIFNVVEELKIKTGFKK